MRCRDVRPAVSLALGEWLLRGISDSLHSTSESTEGLPFRTADRKPLKLGLRSAIARASSVRAISSETRAV